MQWLAKGKDFPQGGFVKMNSNIASGYSFPPDPGGEFYVDMIFSVIVDTIYTTCFNTILHFAHTGFSTFHRILTIRSNFFL
jgi:hypothetical protein